VDTTVTDDGDLTLGAFQEFWDAWSESDEKIKGKKLEHFSRSTEIQYVELGEHLERDDRDAAANEAADVISIALNTFRWMDFEPAEIAKIVRARARNRMRGQTHAILAKYEKQHGI
jgi:hypothetical protein